MPGRKERNYGRGSLPEREEGYYCKGALPKRKGGLMQKGLDREGRRVPSQRRLLERVEGDFTEDAHWKGGLSEKGKGIV